MKRAMITLILYIALVYIYDIWIATILLIFWIIIFNAYSDI